MDGSRRSAHGNAYFTGFGKSRRIVFFDTLLARLNADEIEAVLAHELGHFAKRSEEHTSELQSLMRISYAVFCLKKKIKYNTTEKTTKYHTNMKNNNKYIPT